MNNIKNLFSIKDLENISGISAHAIRIWERRYKLFVPKRTEGNIRTYDIADLQKLLNTVLLKQEGYKISRIAALSDEALFEEARNIVEQAFKKEYALLQLKIIMYKFDVRLFEEFYEKALSTYTFKEVFEDIFLPFLHFVGLFWQTDTIKVAHEHFITNLIYQKIQLQIAHLEAISPDETKPTFILFLPEEEMHEIGLLYLNYELRLKGYPTIYLGRSIPLDDLNHLKPLFAKIYWVSTFTIIPEAKKLQSYFDKVNLFIEDKPYHFWAIGKQLESILKKPISPNVTFFTSLKEAIERVRTL